MVNLMNETKAELARQIALRDDELKRVRAERDATQEELEKLEAEEPRRKLREAELTLSAAESENQDLTVERDELQRKVTVYEELLPHAQDCNAYGYLPHQATCTCDLRFT